MAALEASIDRARGEQSSDGQKGGGKSGKRSEKAPART